MSWLLLYPAIGLAFWVMCWVMDWRQGNQVGWAVSALSLVALLLFWPLVATALARNTSH